METADCLYLPRSDNVEFPPAPARAAANILQQVIDREQAVFSVFTAPPVIPPRFIQSSPIYE
jgi:hypothetical protein